MPAQAFNNLGISDKLCSLLQNEGIMTPTPVQQQSIPLALNGSDLIAQAQTGTGKTLAFALPIIQQIRTDKEHTQALILTPTRELAIQITSELKKYAAAHDVTVLAAYGGQDVEAQIRKLYNMPHIIVATPGRLIDHMQRATVNLGKLSMLVLDEADQMLHMGFLPEVESIITQTPKARQTMLFSATMPDAIRQLAQEYMKQPADVRVQSSNVTLDNIKQIIVETTDRGKQRALIQLLKQHRPYLAVIFCRTKIRAKKLNAALQDYGFESDELHGDLTQAKREQVMKRFREAKLQVLVATDVAARGLDVEGVTHVYNYDVPPDTEHYIHRIGRTGRAGQQGTAVTMATPYDKNTIFSIERKINATIKRIVLDRDGHIQSERSTSSKEQSDYRRSDKHSDARGSRGRGQRTAAVKTGKKPAAQRSATASDNPWQSNDLELPSSKRKQSSKRSGQGQNRSDRSAGKGSVSQNRNERPASNGGGRSDGRSSAASARRGGGSRGGRGKR